MANNTGQKFGGRQKGSTNKNTIEIRTAFQLLVENNIDTLQSDLDSLKPIERIKVIIELGKFIVPTLKAVEMKSEVNQVQRQKIEFVNKTNIKTMIEELENKY